MLKSMYLSLAMLPLVIIALPPPPSREAVIFSDVTSIAIPLSLHLLLFLINSLLIYAAFRYLKITYSRKKLIFFLLFINIISSLLNHITVYGWILGHGTGQFENQWPNFPLDLRVYWSILSNLVIFSLSTYTVLAVNFLLIRWLLKKYFSVSIKRNRISFILSLILFPAFGAYLAGSLNNLSYMLPNPHSWKPPERECQLAPGKLTVTFKNTASLSEVEAFNDGVLIGQFGFNEENILLDVSPPKFFPYRKPFRTASLSPNDEPDPTREITLSDKLQELVGLLRNDPRVERVHHTTTRFQTSRLMGIELRDGISVEQFLSDYPDVILFPEEIEVVNLSLQPGEQIFTYVTFTEELDFLQRLKEEVISLNPDDTLTIVYDDTWGRFAVVFPAHYSQSEIDNFIADARKNKTFLSVESPSVISFRLEVPEGEEDQWIAKLKAYGSIQEVRQVQVCGPIY